MRHGCKRSVSLRYLPSSKSIMGLARIERANPDWSSVTLGDGLAEVCQRSPSSYDDGAADGTTGLAGHKVQASVQVKLPLAPAYRPVPPIMVSVSTR